VFQLTKVWTDQEAGHRDGRDPLYVVTAREPAKWKGEEEAEVMQQYRTPIRGCDRR